MKPLIHVGDGQIVVDTDQYKMVLTTKERPQVVGAKHEDVVFIREMEKNTYESGGAAQQPPSAPSGFRKAPVYKERKCKKCGKMYIPEGPAQKYCSMLCGQQKKNIVAAKQRIELERTLLEIEHSRKKPYEISR
jgi:hypothetical protein